MSSSRAIAVAVITAACTVVARGSAGAQACSISSTAPGPLSCSVWTTVRMTVRIPAMVGVTVTSSQSTVAGAGVRAGLSVKTNRSYALQISRAPMDSANALPPVSSAAPKVEWATAGHRTELDDTPTQIDARMGPADGRAPVDVAFASPQTLGAAQLDPIRLLLTVVAP